MLQQHMIERVREICRQDDRLVAAVMYGSMAKGTGDRFSDIEFVLFFKDEELTSIEPRVWVEQIAPVAVYYRNEFGIATAVFDNLIRGEFHFDRASDIKSVSTWGETDWFPSLKSALVADKSGELTPHLQQLVQPPPDLRSPERMQFIMSSFFNWLVFGLSVMRRGEYARALDLLSWVHRNLLWMVRALEGKTVNWPTPSKSLEDDLSPGTYERFVACTASLEERSLCRAYSNALDWAVEMLTQLAPTYEMVIPTDLVKRIRTELLAE